MLSAKVLVIDDEEEICRLFAELLAAFDYEVVTETDGRQALDHLRGNGFDAILLDLVMPSVNGLELMISIKEEFTEIPVIIVTGYGSIESAVQAMQRGAADFVPKPVDGPVLDLRIRKAIDFERAKRLANTDGLTTLYNHRYFQERLQQETNRANRYNRPLSLIMVDIDHFKAYNDTHGHPEGDGVLIEMARILRALSRTSDVTARYGGEEFALILPETGKQKAATFAQRLCNYVAQHHFPGEEQLPSKVLTVSVGVASFSFPGTREALIKAADNALYQAKNEGRNRVCIAG